MHRVMQSSPQLNHRTFSWYQKVTLHPRSVTPHASLPSSWPPPIYFLSLWICLLWIWNRITSGLLSLASFTKLYVLKIHLCCTTYQNYIFWTAEYPTVWIYHVSIIHLSSDGHEVVSTFWHNGIFGIMNNAAMKFDTWVLHGQTFSFILDN